MIFCVEHDFAARLRMRTRSNACVEIGLGALNIYFTTSETIRDTKSLYSRF
jgi:hypothetical protein